VQSVFGSTDAGKHPSIGKIFMASSLGLLGFSESNPSIIKKLEIDFFSISNFVNFAFS